MNAVESNSGEQTIYAPGVRINKRTVPGGLPQFELLRPGEIFGGSYQILGYLSSGSMGIVYRVRHLTMDCEYALKTLTTQEFDEVTLSRFKNEAQAISLLKHPNIVSIHFFGFHENRLPFYIMELLNGKDMHTQMHMHGRIATETALPLFIEICSGLNYAHSKGILHRDVKPSNFIVLDSPDENGACVKIIDFGIVKFVDKILPEAQQLTAVGNACGSPAYMSPENSGGFAVDARSDIYSLGCSLFEVLTGKIPFNGRTERETMLMHHSTMIPRLSSAAPDQNFPPELEQVVARMMAKAPADRYQSMASVAEDLKNLMEQKPLSTHQKPIEFKICDTQLAEELFRPTQSLEAQAPKAQALEAQSLNALPSKTQSLVRELPFAASQEKQITDDVEQCATTKNSISNEHIHQRRMMHYHLRIAVLTLFYLTGFAGLLWLLLKHPHIQFH
jgi:serine/threonine protein kinase